MDLKDFIRDVPDFPKPGIMFKDITPLLRSPKALEYVSEALAEPFRDAGITGVARVLNAALIPVRKPGKLPWKTRTFEYTLEYGSGALEIHDDALTAGDRALIIDDVLATGGTAAAAAWLVRELGATIVGIGMVIELEFLKGREKLDGTVVHSLLKY